MYSHHGIIKLSKTLNESRLGSCTVPAAPEFGDGPGPMATGFFDGVGGIHP